MSTAWRGYLVVAAGGATGATERWAVGEWLPHAAGGFPWSTVIVNLVGCLGIGLCARRLRHPAVWLFLVTGMLGGLTTFSTFADDTRALVDADRASLAVASVAVTVVGGLAATAIARDRPGPDVVEPEELG